MWQEKKSQLTWIKLYLISLYHVHSNIRLKEIFKVIVHARLLFSKASSFASIFINTLKLSNLNWQLLINSIIAPFTNNTNSH